MIITLTNGMTVLIDQADYKRVSQYNWYFHKAKGYAHSRIDGKLVKLHRFLLNAPDEKQVDHINNDRLDNRRVNLRLCNNQQNSMNRRLHKDSSSGYKGVSYHKARNKWQAYVTKNYKITYLGLYNTAREAAIAYDIAAKKLHGEYAKLNDAAT